MKIHYGVLTLMLMLVAMGTATAQDDQSQQPAAPPAPAFGQDNPAPPVSENPPISGLDQPGLDPHATAESFLLFGLHGSESVDSNVADTLGGSSTTSVTRGLGSVTLQKLWKNYDVAADYLGGLSYYARKGIGLQQLQQLDVDNRITWKRGQLAVRDSFSYLPEGTFGFSAYGGEGAYSMGLGSLGAGMLGAGAFGGQTGLAQQGSITVGNAPRLMNLGLVDVVESLTPKSSITASAGYGLVHFYGNPGVDNIQSFIGSHEFTAQVAYDRILSPKDQAAIMYGYQSFDFSVVGTAFHSNVIQLMYGHRVSGRMSLLVSVGPQFTHISGQDPICSVINVPISQCTNFGGAIAFLPFLSNRIGVAGRFSLQYKFPKTSVTLTYQRYNTSGNGIFLGAQSDVGTLAMTRPLNRVWDLFGNVGYSRNTRLQPSPVGAGVDANHYSYAYAGIGFHRHLSRSLRMFASYQFNYLTFDSSFCTLTVGTFGPCNRISQRHVGSIGLDWTPRPIRLD